LELVRLVAPLKVIGNPDWLPYFAEFAEGSMSAMPEAARVRIRQIQISIHDTGPGLPLGKADQIFDAFFTTKPQGSGMGPSISKSIIEAHGGRIWATVNGDRGATFHFTVPAAPAETNPPVDAA
jgi:signal transduction histidine kinase